MGLKNGYSIGEAAKALDIPASTIRYYEKNGLLPHIGRTEGGHPQFHGCGFGSVALDRTFEDVRHVAARDQGIRAPERIGR